MMVIDNEYQKLAGLATLILSFLILQSTFSQIGQTFADGIAHRAKVKADWIADAKAKNCKSTGFVATKNEVHTIWTCPDNTSYLQP